MMKNIIKKLSHSDLLPIQRKHSLQVVVLHMLLNFWVLNIQDQLDYQLKQRDILYSDHHLNIKNSKKHGN